MKSELSAIPKDGSLESNYKMEDLTQGIGDLINKAEKFAIEDDDIAKGMFKKIQDGFNEVNEPGLKLPISIDDLEEMLIQYQSNIEETTNIRFIRLNQNIQNRDKQSLKTIIEDMLLFPVILMQKLIKSGINFKYLPENTNFKEYFNFFKPSFYDLRNDDFMKGLDHFSLNYIKNIYKEHINKPQQISMDFLELALTIVIVLNSFKKIEHLCLSIKEHLSLKYASHLNNIIKNYSGIKAYHRHKILQFIHTSGNDSFYTKDFIEVLANKEQFRDIFNTAKKSKLSLETMLSNSKEIEKLNQVYNLDGNFSLLIFCIESLISEINKLSREKLIGTINYMWKRKKLPNNFKTGILFIDLYYDMMTNVITVIEQHQDFAGWA